MKITTITQKWSHKNIYQENRARQEPGPTRDQLLQDAGLTQQLTLKTLNLTHKNTAVSLAPSLEPERKYRR